MGCGMIQKLIARGKVQGQLAHGTGNLTGRHTRDETATAHTRVSSLPIRLAKTPPHDGGGAEGDICPLTQHSPLQGWVLGLPAQVQSSKVPGGSYARAGRSKTGNNQGPP